MPIRDALAELVGTFSFLAIGYAAVGYFRGSEASRLAVATCFSLGLLAAMLALGQQSGGHFNPAATLAMVLDKRTMPTHAVGYIVAQGVGAIAAATLILTGAGRSAVADGVTEPGLGVSAIAAFVEEVAMTAGLVTVVLTSTKRRRRLRPAASRRD